MSSIFSMKNLMATSNVPLNNLNDNINESYVSSTTEFIKRFNNDITNYKKSLYVGILESGNNLELVHESFSDFMTNIKNAIVKFLKYIKSLFERFITMLNKFIGREKYILNRKKEFVKFKSSDEFTIEGYNYTFVPNIPVINALATFDEDFVKLNLKGKNSVSAEAEIKRVYDEFKDDYDKYDRHRRDTINAEELISESEFPDELFAVYRSGENSTERITIDASEVMNAFDRFSNYKSAINEVKKTKERIDKEYNEIKKRLDSMVRQDSTLNVNKLLGIEVKSYDENYTLALSSTALSKLDLFVKDKINEVLTMSNIHALAFSYKLDAIRDCATQDKKTLYKALSLIEKSSYKNESAQIVTEGSKLDKLAVALHLKPGSTPEEIEIALNKIANKKTATPLSIAEVLIAIPFIFNGVINITVGTIQTIISAVLFDNAKDRNANKKYNKVLKLIKSLKKERDKCDDPAKIKEIDKCIAMAEKYKDEAAKDIKGKKKVSGVFTKAQRAIRASVNECDSYEYESLDGDDGYAEEIYDNAPGSNESQIDPEDEDLDSDTELIRIMSEMEDDEDDDEINDILDNEDPSMLANLPDDEDDDDADLDDDDLY